MIASVNAVLFKWLNKQPLDEALERALDIASLEVLRDTVRAAPRDTGTLKRSYTIHEGAGLERFVGTNVHYAVYQEFGTRRHKAQPHLGPALERARRKYGG